MSGRSGLVLGGGGLTGIAWEIGLLAGLAEAGVDLGSADLVVGTSAGSVVGAQITSGTPIETLYERQLEPASTEKPASIGLRQKFRFNIATIRARDDVTGLCRRIGRMSTAAAAGGRLPVLEDRLATIKARLPSTEWPDRDLRMTAVDAEMGELRVFTADDGVPLAYAVAASCALPTMYPPVPIEGRRYIDGATRTCVNADVASGCAKVVALAPMPRFIGAVPSTQRQLDDLGVPTVLVVPDRASLAAIGKNILAPAARAGSARAGRAQAATVVDRIRAVWK